CTRVGELHRPDATPRSGRRKHRCVTLEPRSGNASHMCADAMTDRIGYAQRSWLIRAALASSILGLLACRTASTSIAEPQPKARAEDPAQDEARCLPFAGPPGDPNSRGITRAHAP